MTYRPHPEGYKMPSDGDILSIGPSDTMRDVLSIGPSDDPELELLESDAGPRK
jgi:hypothetical protein